MTEVGDSAKAGEAPSGESGIVRPQQQENFPTEPAQHPVQSPIGPETPEGCEEIPPEVTQETLTPGDVEVVGPEDVAEMPAEVLGSGPDLGGAQATVDSTASDEEVADSSESAQDSAIKEINEKVPDASEGARVKGPCSTMDMPDEPTVSEGEIKQLLEFLEVDGEDNAVVIDIAKRLNLVCKGACCKAAELTVLIGEQEQVLTALEDALKAKDARITSFESEIMKYDKAISLHKEATATREQALAIQKENIAVQKKNIEDLEMRLKGAILLKDEWKEEIQGHISNSMALSTKLSEANAKIQQLGDVEVAAGDPPVNPTVSPSTTVSPQSAPVTSPPSSSVPKYDIDESHADWADPLKRRKHRINE